MKRLFILFMLIAVLLIAGRALAMSSTNYRLDWSTALTGGGGSASSTHYAVNFTVGQAAIGAFNSPNHQVGLGYWPGAVVSYRLYLPLILK